jgi:hypothetical protein
MIAWRQQSSAALREEWIVAHINAIENAKIFKKFRKGLSRNAISACMDYGHRIDSSLAAFSLTF